ncbi:MAG: excinuclease ABC subunit UvrA [Fuerstiella sp.]|nr:excinuclease ABC subunit UvrA [Fuerstiella sp.]
MTHIDLEGVRVHNLRGISVRIPHDAVTVICGVSGSGKSSLAFDTLFAEGQRRYVETFSAHARQFLNQLERPDFDRIEGIPPAIAVRQQRRLVNVLSTVGSRTEILRYLQLLFAQTGVQHCPGCSNSLRTWTPDRVAQYVASLDTSARAMIAFPARADSDIDDFPRLGFTRGITGDRSVRLEDVPASFDMAQLLIVVDRILTRDHDRQRILEASRQAFNQGSVCHILVESSDGQFLIDDRRWHRRVCFESCFCPDCRIDCPPVTQDLLSFHTAAGACAECQGTGTVAKHALRSCPSCHGTRLNRFGRSVRLNGVNLPELLNHECGDVAFWLNEVQQSLSEAEARSLTTVFQQLHRRLQFLTDMGLGYLSLDRTLMTLSGGEVRRVVLTSVMGSGMTNTLYVLDEPTSGMHETDVARVIEGIRRLQVSGNTVVVVEHDLDVICGADLVIELGPRAGQDGGDIVFADEPDGLLRADTHTGQALRERDVVTDRQSNKCLKSANWLKIRNVQCHNISGADLDLPLQTLCVVTGVSGSGKSSLIVDALYSELRRVLANDPHSHDAFCEIADGFQYLNDVQLLEQNPLQRSKRSIPVTYLGAFDEIRRLLAGTHEARKRNFTPGTFSFNSAQGGRCEQCHGHGSITIDMQFLADVEATCDSCQGRRFRSDVLEIRYRDRSVDEILGMTAENAFLFFNGHYRIQRSLNGLRQVGLSYLTLGQPLSTLSGGEAQRLRIAALLAGVSSSEKLAKRSGDTELCGAAGTLFILDEPSNGLHAHDSDLLMNCLHQLVQVGHSVVLIEHDRRLIRQCDYRIEMGPGAGKKGGQVMSAAPSV